MSALARHESTDYRFLYLSEENVKVELLIDVGESSNPTMDFFYRDFTLKHIVFLFGFLGEQHFIRSKIGCWKDIGVKKIARMACVCHKKDIYNKRSDRP